MPLDPLSYTVLAGVVGLVVGSFLNVLILRLPAAMARAEEDYCKAVAAGSEPPPPPRFGLLTTLLTPASHCPACKTPIRAVDNIPVLSWLLLRGRCRACSVRIPTRYPIIELATAALTALVAWRFGTTTAGYAAIAVTWVLLALSVIDFDTQYLPDDLTLPLLWAGLLANLWAVFVPLQDAVIGAIAGYLSLWTIYWAFRIFTGREGMGHGDFKLLAALGAWLGWKMLLPIVLLSSVVGALVGVGLILLRRLGRDVPIPFGPYLAAAGFIALLYGPALVTLAGYG